MTDLNKAMPKSVRTLLDNSGLPWWVEPGGAHLKVRLAGKLVAVLPRGRSAKQSTDKRAELNTLSNIKKALRAFEQGDHTFNTRRGG
jgi:hypothetical protein